MDTWYSNGTQLVFACGGGIFTSAAEAAQKVNGKVIGVDTDQSAVIDGGYGGLEASTVINLAEGEPEVIRVGCGDPMPFQEHEA